MTQGSAPGGKTFQVVNPPNLLKKKVGNGGFDPNAIKRMDGAIRELKGEFEEQAKAATAELSAATLALLRAPNDQMQRQTVYLIAHELRGQGGSYGYPLITRFGDQLCRYLDAAELLDAKALVGVKAAADAIAVVIANRVSGDGGETGRQLVGMLDQVVAQVKGEG